MNISIIKNRIARYLIYVVAAYLSLGSLGRIIKIPGLSDSIPITELILYAGATLFTLSIGRLSYFIYRHRFFYLAILTSTTYGILLNGEFNSVAFSYACRLMFIIFSAAVSGYALTIISKGNIQYAAKYFMVTYTLLMIIGFVIFAAFSDSALLWIALEEYGIVFSGDPHQNRFVSPYFDPNYYSVIAAIPMLIGLYMYEKENKNIYLIFTLAIILTIILSGSRSGIAVFLFTYFKLIKNSFRIRDLKIKKYIFFASIVAFMALLLVLFFNFESIDVMITRFSGIRDDESALVRLTSFQEGFLILSESPLFGYGYNFLAVKMFALRSLSSVDSSVLATLINFGVIPTIILLVIMVNKIIILRRRVAKLHFKKIVDKATLGILNIFIFYFLVCLVFASQFNNLIYFQYWLFPVVMISEYFARYIKNMENIGS